MAMRLGQNGASLSGDSQLGRVVNESRHILLLDNVNALLGDAEVVVLLEQGHSAVVGVVGNHDGEGNEEGGGIERAILLEGSSLDSEHILSVVLEVRIVFFDGHNGEGNFNVRVAETLAESTGDEDETNLGELSKTSGLHLVEISHAGHDEHTCGNFWLVPIKGVHVVAGVFQELAGTLDVLLHTGGSHLVKSDNLLSKLLLSLSLTAVEISKEFRLAALFEESSGLIKDGCLFNHF